MSATGADRRRGLECRSWLAGLAVVASALAAAAEPPLAAPNVVPIGPQLVTSGQPSAEALKSLRQRGFEAVIYLAPSTVPDAIADEPQILAAQGIEFVHLPIPFGQPQASDFQAVTQVLTRLQGKKVLVHCQVNMRASSMVFLHRVITQHHDPAQAYEAVAAVWSPRGPWRELLRSELARHQVAFEPY